ncbi:hypothetical protein V2J09_020333 [Rumex salicifolius]
MSLLYTSPSTLFSQKSNLRLSSSSLSSSPRPHFLSFPTFKSSGTFLGVRSSSEPTNPPPDEWGEKSEPEPVSAYSRLTEPDPPIEKDEWGGADIEVGSGNGSAQVDVDGGDKNLDLKRCLVDSVYGTDLGFQASPEVRAELSELVNQLEAANPTPNPTEDPALLDGNWVLLYTAFSELLPLLALGNTPLFKVEKISQSINTSNSTIDNSTTLSTPFASITFSASASFEVRTSSRIQVQFKEGVFNPPEIKSQVDLPDTLNIFGQTISLFPVQQTLAPLQEAFSGIARALSGQPPLKVPIPGEKTSSWLLITYLDKDLRIARGDGGIFVLAREGSPLLYQ